MLELVLEFRRALVLSLEHQQRLARRWDRINSDPGSFVTRERRGVATLEEIAIENTVFGFFAEKPIHHLRERSTKADVFRRLAAGKKILAFGYGQGWDSGWLENAGHTGLQTCWIDISSVACKGATEETSTAWEKMWQDSHFLPPAPPPGLSRRGPLHSP